MRAVALLVLVVFPGFGFTAVSTYWLWRDWAALTASHQRYMQVATANPTQTDLMIAAAAETRHRINCFAGRSGGFCWEAWFGQLGFTASAPRLADPTPLLNSVSLT
ncbi:hypothetical protein [Leptolyngbya sp. NK1-12]|uniref:hypothetical protein n=1 Tax=Leptolyngbya sp. NK1-12 TaxID=2547451 RepID=UPI002930DE5D|nr:hypothetical protein [Leptolyngbya sp. NK1-12]